MILHAAKIRRDESKIVLHKNEKKREERSPRNAHLPTAMKVTINSYALNSFLNGPAGVIRGWQVSEDEYFIVRFERRTVRCTACIFFFNLMVNELHPFNLNLNKKNPQTKNPDIQKKLERASRRRRGHCL
jgi:hypothetical protein